MTSRNGLNIFLFCLLLCLFAMNWTIRSNPQQRNLEFFAEMVHSIAYESQSGNPHFTNGKNLLLPVPGTISRGTMPLHYAATDEDAIRAGDKLKSPFAPDDPIALGRGEFIFRNFCTHCHGVSGSGDGPVPKRGFPPPASFLAQNIMELKDGAMFHSLTYGKGNMPSHASQISRDDRWCVINYIRKLQKDETNNIATVNNEKEAKEIQ